MHVQLVKEISEEEKFWVWWNWARARNVKMKIERGGIFNGSRLEEEKVIMFGISYVKWAWMAALAGFWTPLRKVF